MKNHVHQLEIKNNYRQDHIRSFVLRRRRLSKRQKQALDGYWPKLGVEFNNKLLNYAKLFNSTAPVILEIGFGMGVSLVAMAKANPQCNFLGIEVYFPGVGSCLALAHEEGVKNLRLMHYDAVEVLYKMIPDNSLNIVQIFFPDPWQKSRHKKRRIIQVPFVKIVKKKLKIGGFFHIITDWQQYAEHILKVISFLDGYENQSQNNYPHFLKSRPITKFEQRSYLLGHNIWNLLFKKIK